MGDRVSFTVYASIMDEIETGIKTSEWRVGERWRWLVDATPTRAVFISGRRIYRCAVDHVVEYTIVGLDMPQLIQDRAKDGDVIFEVVLGRWHNHQCTACLGGYACYLPGEGGDLCDGPELIGRCCNRCADAWVDTGMADLEEMHG